MYVVVTNGWKFNAQTVCDSGFHSAEDNRLTFPHLRQCQLDCMPVPSTRFCYYSVGGGRLDEERDGSGTVREETKRDTISKQDEIFGKMCAQISSVWFENAFAGYTYHREIC